MAYRLRKSLVTFRAQVNAAAPGRDKASDGGPPSAAHLAQNPASDHNTGHAFDVTHDPAHGVDCNRIAAQLAASRDERIKYIIWNARIMSSAAHESAKPAGTNRNTPWIWRTYTGSSNMHTKHLHLSVMPDPLADDPRAWAITFGAAPQPATRQGMFSGITATVFGGPNDSMAGQNTAYGLLVAHGWWDRPGVALPARLTMRPLPLVRVHHNGKSVVCPVIDVGPWNTADRYWEVGTRPQAETGRDISGRKTNLAGIDLTPAAANAIGLEGKGLVDWEFVDVQVLPPLKPEDTMDTETRITAAVIAALRAQGVIPQALLPPPAASGFEQFMPLLQHPVVQKLFSGQAVTIVELLPLIPGVMAIMAPAPRPVAPTSDIVKPAAVGLSGLALAASTALIEGGAVGTPFGIGENPTMTGTLMTAIPLIAAAVGAMGGFGPLVSGLAGLFGYGKKA